MKLLASAGCHRSGNTVEVFQPGQRKVVFRRLAKRDADLLEIWAGPDRPRSRALAATVEQLGHSPDRFHAAVAQLHLAGLAGDPSLPRAAPSSQSVRVGIVGLGRLGLLIAQGLLDAPLTELQLDDPRIVTTNDLGPGGYRLADIGGKRVLAAAAHLRERTDRVVVGDRGLADPDFVVVTSEARDVSGTAHLVCSGTPHLLVVATATTTEVGPLVLPGHTACANCIELQRRGDPVRPRPHDASSTDGGRAEGEPAIPWHRLPLPEGQQASGAQWTAAGTVECSVPPPAMGQSSNALVGAALAISTAVMALGRIRAARDRSNTGPDVVMMSHLEAAPLAERRTDISTTSIKDGHLNTFKSNWNAHPDCGCADNAGLWTTMAVASA